MAGTDRHNRANALLIGIVGAGKIARDEHIPAIQNSGMFKLAGCAHCKTPIEAVPNFPDLVTMIDALPDIDAIAVCSPPQAHYEAACLALQMRKHVLLEKPPCPTVTQLDYLAQMSARMGRTLFQTWHLCESETVEAAHRWLMSRTVRRGRIIWKEDVGRWHPGQAWLWQTDGFGVFDAGINALSVLTKIFPDPIYVKSAELLVPSNCQTPIAANVVLAVGNSEFIAEFDFRHAGDTLWEIEFETSDGTGRLAAQYNTFTVDGTKAFTGSADDNYPRLYARFDQLIRERRSEIDKRPLKLVADIFLVGRHITVDPFEISQPN